MKATKGLPRATIEELTARWEFGRLRLLVVEGPGDQRYFSLLKQEEYCLRELHNLDVWSVDSIDVPSRTVLERGFTGAGAKQRAVALMRILEDLRVANGFRSVVDRDWDGFLGIDHGYGSVIYTDYCCREAGFWSEQLLRRLIVQFRADSHVDSTEKLRELYVSISEACAGIAAVRIVNELRREFGLSLSYSDKAFVFRDGRVEANIEMIVAQSKPGKGLLAEVLEYVNEIHEELKGHDRRMLCHGHDLVFVTTFALKAASSQRAITIESVENAFVMIAMIEDHVAKSLSLGKIQAWLREDGNRPELGPAPQRLDCQDSTD